VGQSCAFVGRRSSGRPAPTTLHPPPGNFRSGTVIRSSHDEHRPRIELYEVPVFSYDKLALAISRR
jgi:hypothetical protein